MNAVLLCAGFATRMYPLTRNFPKPLLPVAGQPVIDYLMDQLSALDSIDAVHLVSNRRFLDHFQRWRENHIERGTYRRLRIEIYDDGCTDNETRLGASGDLMLALHMIGTPDKILVSGGDNIYRFPLAPLWKSFLRGSGHRITAIEETDAARLKQTGVLEFGEADRVVRLHEKAAQPPSNWTCPPLYFFQPSVWEELERFLKTSNNHDAPGHLIDFLCVHSRVEAFRIDGDRLDIGSVETYRQAEELLAKQFD